MRLNAIHPLVFETEGRTHQEAPGPVAGGNPRWTGNWIAEAHWRLFRSTQEIVQTEGAQTGTRLKNNPENKPRSRGWSR